MVSIKGCKRQGKGIRFIKPNDNLVQEYLSQADENLTAMELNKGKWKIITAYYACYEALYAILMKLGVKCEIHEYTLKLMESIDSFDQEEVEFITDLKKSRIDAQYYMKEKQFDQEEQVKAFVLKCKDICEHIDIDNTVKKIREEIK